MTYDTSHMEWAAGPVIDTDQPEFWKTQEWWDLAPCTRRSIWADWLPEGGETPSRLVGEYPACSVR